jgi:acetoacetyl-CoA synthetase
LPGEGQKSVVKKTFSELRKTVARFAAAMRAMGVAKGDRVVGYIPNCAEAVEAMLAAASIGAIWSSTSPDFGVVVSTFKVNLPADSTWSGLLS